MINRKKILCGLLICIVHLGSIAQDTQTYEEKFNQRYQNSPLLELPKFSGKNWEHIQNLAGKAKNLKETNPAQAEGRYREAYTTILVYEEGLYEYFKMQEQIDLFIKKFGQKRIEDYSKEEADKIFNNLLEARGLLEQEKFVAAVKMQKENFNKLLEIKTAYFDKRLSKNQMRNRIRSIINVLSVQYSEPVVETRIDQLKEALADIDVIFHKGLSDEANEKYKKLLSISETSRKQAIDCKEYLKQISEAKQDRSFVTYRKYAPDLVKKLDDLDVLIEAEKEKKSLNGVNKEAPKWLAQYQKILSLNISPFWQINNSPTVHTNYLAPGSNDARILQLEQAERFACVEIKFKQSQLVLRLIPAGSANVGSSSFEPGRMKNEVVKNYTAENWFYMCSTEITQDMWEKLMAENPSEFRGKKLPVENVSYQEIQVFLKKLCEFEGIPEEQLRLPTQEEWEYAARAGTRTPTYMGTSLDTTMANFNGKYPYGSVRKSAFLKKTVPVGEFKPNAYGLYNMIGNVSEWVTKALVEEDVVYITKGGSWQSTGAQCRAAAIQKVRPDIRTSTIGFRIVYTPPNLKNK